MYVSTQPPAPQEVSQEAGGSTAVGLVDSTSPETEAQTYTIVFNPNGGDGTMQAQTAASDSVNLDLNAFHMQDYVFTGWNTQADGSGASYSDGQAVSALADAGGTATLYARWEKDPAVIAAEQAAAERAKQEREANAQAFAEQVLTNWPDKSEEVPSDYDTKGRAMKYAAPGSKLAKEGIREVLLWASHVNSSQILDDDGSVVTIRVNTTQAGADVIEDRSFLFHVTMDENALVTDYDYEME